jgi:hypothetical protein
MIVSIYVQMFGEVIAEEKEDFNLFLAIYS